MRPSVSTHLQSVVILQTLAGRHSQIILTWSTNNINQNHDSELSTNHEEDRSLDTVNVPDGRHAEHGLVALAVRVGPVVAQPDLVVSPVGNISDARHTEGGDEAEGLEVGGQV